MKEIEGIMIDGEEINLKQYAKRADFDELKEKIEKLTDGDEVEYGSE